MLFTTENVNWKIAPGVLPGLVTKFFKKSELKVDVTPILDK
jgi:hypothetical protein